MCRFVCSCAVGMEFLVLAPSPKPVGGPWEPDVVLVQVSQTSESVERLVALADPSGGLFCKVPARPFCFLLVPNTHLRSVLAEEQ